SGSWDGCGTWFSPPCEEAFDDRSAVHAGLPGDDWPARAIGLHGDPYDQQHRPGSAYGCRRDCAENGPRRRVAGRVPGYESLHPQDAILLRSKQTRRAESTTGRDSNLFRVPRAGDPRDPREGTGGHGGEREIHTLAPEAF